MTEELDNITPEELDQFVKGIVYESTRSARHRKPIPKGTLKELASWEREVLKNYGVLKKGANR